MSSSFRFSAPGYVPVPALDLPPRQARYGLRLVGVDSICMSEKLLVEDASRFSRGRSDGSQQLSNALRVRPSFIHWRGFRFSWRIGTLGALSDRRHDLGHSAGFIALVAIALSIRTLRMALERTQLRAITAPTTSVIGKR